MWNFSWILSESSGFLLRVSSIFVRCSDFKGLFLGHSAMLDNIRTVAVVLTSCLTLPPQLPLPGPHPGSASPLLIGSAGVTWLQLRHACHCSVLMTTVSSFLWMQSCPRVCLHHLVIKSVPRQIPGAGEGDVLCAPAEWPAHGPRGHSH